MQSAPVAPHKLAVSVLYNGITKTLDYEPHEQGRALFERACQEFGIPGQERDALTLYQSDGTTEVPLDVPVEQGGVKPDTTIILRGRQSSGA
jgi:hypothetical protein